MIINTEYNVGDRVWFLDGWKNPQEGVISKITVEVSGNDISIFYVTLYNGGDSRNLRPKDAFNSKKEAIEHYLKIMGFKCGIQEIHND